MQSKSTPHSREFVLRNKKWSIAMKRQRDSQMVFGNWMATLKSENGKPNSESSEYWGTDTEAFGVTVRQ